MEEEGKKISKAEEKRTGKKKNRKTRAGNGGQEDQVHMERNEEDE
jgi:hypothetical protein